MIATVCELPNDPAALAEVWPALCAHVSQAKSDFVLLPEMPFSVWLAGDATVDPAAWRAAVAAHEKWIARLGELGAPVVAGTRPTLEGDARHNRGFIWSAEAGHRDGHAKSYLPDEPGFWEASWYDRGPTRFEVARDPAHPPIGFAICTELWFGHVARGYAGADVDLALTPRATYAGSTEKWIAGGRAFAVASGAYSLSSNFAGPAAAGRWGGSGWIIEPEEGDVLARTSPAEPFVSQELDLGVAHAAKRSYPRYVDDRPIP